MPQVTMPDNTVVELPDKMTPELQERLNAVVAKSHESALKAKFAKGEAHEEIPKDLPADAPETSTTAKKDSKLGFVTGNLNKGIASALGGPVDLAELGVNTVKAAQGTIAGAMGRTKGMPDIIEGSVGGSQWFEGLMKQHKLITDAATPRTKSDKIAATVLQGGAAMAGGVALAGTGGKALNAAKSMVDRPPPKGTIKPDPPSAELVKELRQEGYVFSPTQIRPNMVNRTAEGFGGKRELQQDASIKNQETHNNMARGDLGVSINTPLSKNTLQLVKNEAYEPYKKVRALPDNFKLDTAYVQKITELNGEFAALESKFPGLTRAPEVEELKNILINDKALAEGVTPGEAVDLSRLLRQKATANYKAANSPGGKPENLAIAQAQRDAAKAVEDVISKGVKEAKQYPGLFEEWKEARKRLAMTHDVESVLNFDTQNINAPAVASLSRKGRPLTGGLEKVAKFARSFPDVVQTPEKIGGVAGNWKDTVLMAGGAASGAHVAGPAGSIAGFAAGAVARPATRAALLSKFYQDKAVARGKPKAKKKPIEPTEEED